MQHTDRVGILPGEQMKFTKDKERNNHRKLYRERQYPILRLEESQRGVRILSKRKRGMLLGVRIVLIVPLWYKLKPKSPRDADTANTLFLEVCYVPAVCEAPVSLRERGFVPSDCDIKINTIHEGWWLGRGVFTKGEDTHTLRLKSEFGLAAARSRSRENNT